MRSSVPTKSQSATTSEIIRCYGAGIGMEGRGEGGEAGCGVWEVRGGGLRFRTGSHKAKMAKGNIPTRMLSTLNPKHKTNNLISQIPKLQPPNRRRHRCWESVE
jgi:hypothetical protein